MIKTDEELMAAYVAGDEHAMTELLRRYTAVLKAFFTRHGQRSQDAEDMIQDTFLNLHRSRADYRVGEALRPWIFTIARNRGRDCRRRQRRRPEWLCDLDVHAAPRDANSAPVDGERARVLHLVLADLPVADRELLDEHWLREQSFVDISARRGVNSTTLRVRAHRACLRLRCMMQTDLDACDATPLAAA